MSINMAWLHISRCLKQFRKQIQNYTLFAAMSESHQFHGLRVKTVGGTLDLSWKNIVVNLSPPSAAYMCQWIGSALVQMMACSLFGAKPLSKPMLGYGNITRYFFVNQNSTNTAEGMVAYLTFEQLKVKIFNNFWFHLEDISRNAMISDTFGIFYGTFPKYGEVKPIELHTASSNPVDTERIDNNVIFTSKRRCNVVFGVIMTLLSRHVTAVK